MAKTSDLLSGHFTMSKKCFLQICNAKELNKPGICSRKFPANDQDILRNVLLRNNTMHEAICKRRQTMNDGNLSCCTRVKVTLYGSTSHPFIILENEDHVKASTCLKLTHFTIVPFGANEIKFVRKSRTKDAGNHGNCSTFTLTASHKCARDEWVTNITSLPKSNTRCSVLPVLHEENSEEANVQVEKGHQTTAPAYSYTSRKLKYSNNLIHMKA